MAASQGQATPAVWDGTPLPDGARIAFRASRYLFGDGIQGWAADFTHSAGMMFQPYRFTQSEPTYDYLVVSEDFINLTGFMTVETWPAAEGESFPWWPYTKCILLGENGKYLETNCAGALSASAERDGARVFCITVAYGKSAIFDAGYLYGDRARMDLSLGGNQQNGAFTLMPYGAPPKIPIVLHVRQGFGDLTIVRA